MTTTNVDQFRLFDALSSLVVVVDSEVRVVYCNPVFSEVTGWALAELRGRSFVDLLPITVAGEEMLAALHTGNVERIECEILRRSNGRTTAEDSWIAWKISPLEGPERLVLIDGVDHSAHAKDRRALRDAEHRLRSLTEQAPYGIFITDPDGRLVEANPAFCRMLGYSRGEIAGKPATDFIPRQYIAQFADEKMLSRQGSQLAEWLLTRKDGSRLHVEASTWLLANGNWQGFLKDITERKRLSETLRVARTELSQSRSRLRSIIDNAYQFIGLLAADGTLLEANRSALRIVGAKREDTIGRPFWETAWWAGDPEQKLRLRHGIEAAADGRFVRFDATHPTLDGRRVNVDFSLTPVRDAHGNVTHMVAEGRDITDRKRVEAALHVSEARLSRLVSNASDAIISIDEDQRIILFNHGAEQIFGWKSEEVLHQPLDMLIPARFRDLHRQHIREFARETPATRPMAERNAALFALRKSGDEFPIEAGISSVELEGKHIFTVMLRDISKRVLLQREVERRLEQQCLLADLGSTLASAHDYDEVLIRVAELIAARLAKFCIAYAARDGRIDRVKVACGDPAYAASVDELGRQPVDAVQHGVIRALILSGQPRLAKELTPEALGSHLMNEELYARVAALDPRSGIAVPLVARGRGLGAFLLLSSDADRLYCEEDVRLAMLIAGRTAVSLDALDSLRVAREAAQARDEMLGFIAHDLRNPLTLVELAAQRITDQVPADADDVRRGLARIARGVARANRLVEDLLDLRRPEADFKLAMRPHAPRHLVDEALELQRPLAAAASVSLQTDIPEALPAVNADQDRVVRVVENLLTNAVKFTPSGGRISVGAASRDQDVLFWVKDSGRGIRPEDLPHVFEPFWRANGPEHGSVGLGLPIARRIVEAHAGHIWAESEEGAGACFFFTLPKAIPHTPSAQPG